MYGKEFKSFSKQSVKRPENHSLKESSQQRTHKSKSVSLRLVVSAFICKNLFVVIVYMFFVTKKLG